MLDSILAASTGSITPVEIALCTLTSLAMGAVIACVYMYRGTYTKNFVVTIVLLPVMIQSVIMVVNGNLGTGVAVAGAFSLVRFRSVPGSAKEIANIFFAMAVGLAAGMGYIFYAAAFTVVIGAVMLLLAATRFGEQDSSRKSLKVTIPEDMDYTGIFDDLFAQYTRSASLERARTTNLGSLYELQYIIVQKDSKREKELLDKIRQRNGNLTVSCGRIAVNKDEL